MGEYQHIQHTFEPVFNRKSGILILGSLPSVKSREQGFYYGHPRNRFWKVLSSLLECPEPGTIQEKKEMLLAHGIAVWDVIESCDIIGSSDSSIRNAVPTPVGDILQKSNVSRVYANGKTAAKLYRQYVYPGTRMEIIELPSTSPANAAYSLQRLIQVWGDCIGNIAESVTKTGPRSVARKL